MISFPLNITSKLGNNDAQITTYLEKQLPEVRKDAVGLKIACPRVKWGVTEEILTALYASETDGIYMMALLKLTLLTLKSLCLGKIVSLDVLLLYTLARMTLEKELEVKKL